MNTQKTVDAADLTYVDISFTVTLNGVTSDPITNPIDISSLFGATTTAGKLRMDKAKIPNGEAGLGIFYYFGMLTDYYFVLKPEIRLSTGVYIPVSYATGVDITNLEPGQVSVKADAGGSVRMALAVIPDGSGSAIFEGFNLSCAGTSYRYDAWVSCLIRLFEP